MKIVLKFSKGSPLKYISHLDLQRLFTRAFRRAGIPLILKGGFNPQPKMSFAQALPLGYTSRGEYLEVEVGEGYTPEMVKRQLAAQLPRGISLRRAREISSRYRPLMARVSSMVYRVKIISPRPIKTGELEKALAHMNKRKELTVIRKRKGKVREFDARPLLKDIKVVSPGELELHLKMEPGGSVKPLEIMELLENIYPLGMTGARVQRQDIVFSS